MSSLSKTYFHPVLSKNNRDFIDGSEFSVELDPRLVQNKKEDSLCLDYRVKIKAPGIIPYISEGHAKIFLDVYSKETLSRQMFLLNEIDGTIEFKPGEVMGILEVQAYIVAARAIKKYAPEGINSEYGDNDFDIEAGSVLAVEERVLLPLSFKRVKLESIIRVQKSDDIDSDGYSINLESNIITVLMGNSFHALWDIMRSDNAVKPYLYLSVYKDTFVEALSLINKSEDFEEFAWAQALIAKCENAGIDIRELVDFASQNQAALLLLREFGVHKLLESEA